MGVRRLRLLFSIVIMCAAACVSKSSVPEASVQRVLTPGLVSGVEQPPEPFRVVFAGPEGETSEVSAVSVVFNRPLRALDMAAASAEQAVPIRMTPAVPGAWQWVGTRALLFAPEGGRLPAATAFQVEIPAGVRALDGARLGKPHQFRFTTPRPALVRSIPYEGEEGVQPGARVDLRFNQPIEPQALQRALKLQVARGTALSPIAFSAAHPDPKDRARLLVTPARPLPTNSVIVLSLDAGLTGAEGPLPSGKARELRFRTYGPLRVESYECDRETPRRACAPGSALSFTFSNPVKYGDLRRALSVNPPVKLRFGEGLDDDVELRYVSVYGPFAAATSYVFSVAPSLRDRYGQTLGRPYNQSVAFDDHWPALQIGASGDYFEPALSRAIPVGSVNLARYSLITTALSPEQALHLEGIERDLDKYEFLAKVPRRTFRTIEPKAPKNTLARQAVEPAAVLGGAGPRGALAIATRFADPRTRRPNIRIKVVQVTDLALSAKLSRHGSVVWVTRLSSGAPVAGARVEILQPGKKPLVYNSDALGIARVPAKDFSPQLSYDEEAPAPALLVARAGGEWAYRAAADYIDPWRINVPVDVSGRQSRYGLLFTERGLYRPGDAVQVKGIVRVESPSGNALPDAGRMTLVLRSPQGEETSKHTVTLTRFGTFALELRLPRSAELGSWSLSSTSSAGSAGGELYGHFEVAEYRPAEFKVSAESDSPSYLRGARASWSARADYLYGAPMKGALARWSLSRGPTSFSPPGSDGFVTDASAYYADLREQALNAGELTRGETKLDAQGQLTLAHRLDLPGQRGPELVRLDVEVSDVNRQTFSASTSAIVHPAQHYVGLKLADDAFVRAPGKARPEVRTYSASGQVLTGKRVKLELIQRRWTLVRKQASDTEVESVSKPVDTVVARCELQTAVTPTGCELGLEQSGYYIVRASSSDAAGNRTEAATALYAIGNGNAWWSDSDDRSLELVANKKQYLPGETARVLVKSPFPEAEALVTVERAGVYRSERVTLRGPTPTVTVPITDDMRPNAYVGVHLIRPRVPLAAPGGDTALGEPTYRIGYTELTIDPESRRMKVALTPNKRDLTPGEELAVNLAVTDHRGKPARAELTVYAVDEGVLSLIGYRTPDPVPVFTASRPLQVATLESRAALARVALLELGELGLDKGAAGGGGGDASGARRDFRQSAYFNPAVLTDEQGRAQVRFKLPESLTTYRLMAVAVSAGDAYGFSATNVTTSKQLMARPALPRFLRAGDSFEAGVVLSSKGIGAARATVGLRASGVTVTGPERQSVSLPPGHAVEVRFAGRAERAGEVRFRFDASGELTESKQRRTVTDSVEVTRAVHSPAALENVALYGKTSAAVAEQLGDLRGARADVGALHVNVAATALVGLEGGVDQLIDYPYGCSEQLASRLLPLLPLRDLARDFDIDLPKSTDALVERTIADLLGRQRGDGGFPMWADSEQSSPWVSSYVLWTLHQAQRRGAAVPKRALESARDYARSYLGQLENQPVELATAAFTLDVLAEVGAPDHGYLTRLFERRKELPLFGRALLLHAMAVAKHEAKSQQVLARELENQLRLEGSAAYAAENTGDEYAVVFDSPARTSALILRALLATQPHHPLGDELARGLLNARRNGSWRSTQETAYALLALDAYRKAQEPSEPDFDARVWFGSTEILKAGFHARTAQAKSYELPMSKLHASGPARLTFEKQGEGTLFYEARLRYAPRELPRDPLDRGFFVQKTWRKVRVEDLKKALASVPERGVTEFTGGDLVLTDLVVITPSPREYVVIDDPLPAGFEAIDSGLASTAGWLGVSGSISDDCQDCERATDSAPGGFQSSWFRSELRDDRALFFVERMSAGMYHYRYLARATTLGSFVVPPTKVERMYAPEVFGRTAATRATVR